MWRFLASQLQRRAERSLTLALGIVVAAVSFVLLTSAAATSALHVRGTLRSNFRGAYDILVRPNASFTPLERRAGLVRDNYLSGMYGGITLRQYAEIAHLPGVEVAAPIANIGTVLAEQTVAIRLAPVVDGQKDQLFRVHLSWVAQGALSRYPASDEYLYATRRRIYLGPGDSWAVRDPVAGHLDMACNGYNASAPIVAAPFVPVNSSRLYCTSPNIARSPLLTRAKKAGRFEPVVLFQFEFPLDVAAIDPEAEAKLVGLSRAMVVGKYLNGASRPRLSSSATNPWRQIPVVAASRSFLDEQLQAKIERLIVPPRTNVPGMLGAGACGGNDLPAGQGCQAPGAVTREAGPAGHRTITAYEFLSGLRGSAIGTRSVNARNLYSRAARNFHAGSFSLSHIVVDAYWRHAAVRYRQRGSRILQPETVSNGPTQYVESFRIGSGYLDQPTDNRDTQFRTVTDTSGDQGTINGSEIRVPQLKVLGLFDPLRLLGFSSLSRVPLETYYPPTLTAADQNTRALLRGKPLSPSQNLGDYEQQPPSLLTNLHGIAPLLSALRFGNVSQRQRQAPISVIRIRVKGVSGPDSLSETRIRTVAELIHDRTGLDVDITAGSSPTRITIRLPRGMFGRPALVLNEGWVEKGVSVTYLAALDRKNVALYALILAVCSVFLLNGSLAAVRGRRSEIGVLLTLGWSRGSIFRAVLGELCLVGLAAGAVGTAVAALVATSFQLALPISRTLYVLPIAVGLALLGGVVPAIEASRGLPMDALRPPVRSRRHRGRARTLPALALINVTRLPLRSFLGGFGLFLGVAALTVLLAIQHSFQGTLVSTLLGNAISLQVRAADFVAIGLTIGLAALSAADVLYLNLRERAAELATLRASGWSSSQVSRLVVFEAGGLGAAAALAGAGVGVGVGALLLAVPGAALALSASLAATGGFVVAVAASLIPAQRVLRLTGPATLAVE